MKPNELPVYPSNNDYESGIFNKYNQLVAVTVGEGHFETACLICHLLNQAFGVEPNHYYPVVVPVREGALLSAVAGGLAARALQGAHEEGKTIEIPSLGIKIELGEPPSQEHP